MNKELTNPLPYILAGKAIFTVQNIETDNRYTYKVYESKRTRNMFIVNVLYQHKYRYIGIIKNNQYLYSKKCELSPNCIEVKGFNYIFHRIIDNTLPEAYKIYHSGKCGRCGRILTTPESLELGFGSECIKKIKAP